MSIPMSENVGFNRLIEYLGELYQRECECHEQVNEVGATDLRNQRTQLGAILLLLKGDADK